MINFNENETPEDTFNLLWGVCIYILFDFLFKIFKDFGVEEVEK